MTRRILLGGWLAATLGRAGERTRRVRITATLRRRERSWWKKPLGEDDVDGLLVSWGVAALLGPERRVLAQAPSMECPQDPFCLGWDPTNGRCLDLFAAGRERWAAEYSCYAANRTIFFERETEIYCGRLPLDVEGVEAKFYYRDRSLQRSSWRPGAVRLMFADHKDVSLEARIELIAGPDGDAKQVRIGSCQPGSEDPAALALRLQAGKFRYCATGEGGCATNL